MSCVPLVQRIKCPTILLHRRKPGHGRIHVRSAVTSVRPHGWIVILNNTEKQSSCSMRKRRCTIDRPGTLYHCQICLAEGSIAKDPAPQLEIPVHQGCQRQIIFSLQGCPGTARACSSAHDDIVTASSPACWKSASHNTLVFHPIITVVIAVSRCRPHQARSSHPDQCALRL